VIMATRWHPDDLSGRQIDAGWQYVNLPAIAEQDDLLGREEGEPLDPIRWPADVLLDRRREVGEYTWASLYQGRPRPRGGSVFGEATYYDELPRSAYRVGRGVDLAYTAKTHADYSVFIELWRVEGLDPLTKKPAPIFYVVDVARKQVDAPSFTLTLKAKNAKHSGTRMRWDASGTEKGSADFIKKAGIPLDVHQAKGDPFQRVQHVAAAWNAGRIMVPNTDVFTEAEQWLHAFVDELQSFTGVSDANDDQAVALASAHASLMTVQAGGGAGRGQGQPRAI